MLPTRSDCHCGSFDFEWRSKCHPRWSRCLVLRRSNSRRADPPATPDSGDSTRTGSSTEATTSDTCRPAAAIEFSTCLTQRTVFVVRPSIASLLAGRSIPQTRHTGIPQTNLLLLRSPVHAAVRPARPLTTPNGTHRRCDIPRLDPRPGPCVATGAGVGIPDHRDCQMLGSITRTSKISHSSAIIPSRRLQMTAWSIPNF